MTTTEEKYGKKIDYDPLWKGPMETIRTPTDRIWLIVFAVFLAIFICTAGFGFYAGNYNRFIVPSDIAGRACGIDEGVKDKPYFVFFDLKSCAFSPIHCALGACVSKCPTENFIYDEKLSPYALEQVKEKLICNNDVNITAISTVDQLNVLMKHEKCARWYLESESKHSKCIPTKAWAEHEVETISAEDLRNATNHIQKGEQFLRSVYKDIKLSGGPISAAIVGGGIITLAYVVLLTWFAVPFFYVSICMFCAIIGFFIYLFSRSYAENKSTSELVILIILVFLVVAIIAAVIYFRKKIYLACQLIRESSKAVMHLPSTLSFPILSGLLYITVVIFSLLVFMSLASISKPVYQIEDLGAKQENCMCQNYTEPLIDHAICNPTIFNEKCRANGQPCQLLHCSLKDEITPGYLYVFLSVNIIGFYWLLFFVSGCEHMILGGTFASWYWTHNKKNVGNYALIESMCRTIKYHLGTIAIGSLILTIAQIIRMILKGIEGKLRDSEHAVAALFMSCFRFLFDMLDAFLNFLNYNAYIMCAVHGKSFCNSAKSAFNLIMRNVVKIIVVDTVADCLFAMAKLLITSITVGSVYLYYNHTTDDLPLAAIAVTAVGTYIICSAIISVQSVAVKTIFLSFVEDSERNNGSDEKPYYMSKKLEKLLHK